MVDPQNVNARYIDKFNSGGTTSIKTHAPPGGKSTFSLGWGMDSKEVETKKTTKVNDDNLYTYNTSSNTSNTNTGKTFKNFSNKSNEVSQQQDKTSVKVKYAPGGQSSIKFG